MPKYDPNIADAPPVAMNALFVNIPFGERPSSPPLHFIIF